jgi:hypothetical protein
MKNEFIEQYNHTWNILEGLVRDFDEDAWVSLGHGYIVPARLAYHILHSTQYYIEDSSVIASLSGRSFDGDWLTMDVNELPLPSDILHALKEFRLKTEKWLSDMDFNAKNTAFGWAGETKIGVAIFLLRHTLYHLGELNALLYESKNGKAEDNFIKAFR